LAEDLLGRFPAGLIVEEYIEGRDLVVPFLEAASKKTGGILEPGAYRFDGAAIEERRFNIYDYALKSTDSHAVRVVVPADVPPKVRDEARDLARTIYAVLGVRDAGRVDFRLDLHGRLHFLEINALPSLEPGASIYESAAVAGLSTVEDVIGSIVESAARRHGLDPKKGKSKGRRPALRVGLTYNLRRTALASEGDTSSDEEAEYDAPETIDAIADAIRSYGHDVVLLEATPELPTRLPASDLDLVFNIAEGVSGRNRESQVPALLELLGVPYTGSDPVALSASLDKALAKKVVAHAGLKTPAFTLMRTGRERLPKDFSFPVIAKPVAEGSSKGVGEKSVAATEEELRTLVPRIAMRYGQPVLVESFLPGREFTVALLGERRPRALPPMEILFDESAVHPTYSFAHKFEGKAIRFEVPAKVDARLGKELERVARGAFVALGCRDVARADLRLDADGHVCFIEMNPLPGLTPGFSDLCLIADAAGLDYRTLVGEIMAPAIRRLKEQRRRQNNGSGPLATGQGDLGTRDLGTTVNE
jgi:D-alanine-D-alanine ligase